MNALNSIDARTSPTLAHSLLLTRPVHPLLLDQYGYSNEVKGTGCGSINEDDDGCHFLVGLAFRV